MEQSKVRTYIFYAIGEILLVVIGILLALQVNNWNEQRVDRNYEVKVLSEIQSALENDINHFDRMINRMIRLDSAVQVMKLHVFNKDVFIDSLYNRSGRWYQLRTGIAYSYNRGPYDALKSTGLDKISSDSLRNALINYFDFSARQGEIFILYSDRNYDAETERLESFLGDSFMEMNNGELTIYSRFPEDLFLKPDFLELLHDLEYRANSQIHLLQRQRNDMVRLNNLINQHL